MRKQKGETKDRQDGGESNIRKRHCSWLSQCAISGPRIGFETLCDIVI